MKIDVCFVHIWVGKKTFLNEKIPNVNNKLREVMKNIALGMSLEKQKYHFKFSYVNLQICSPGLCSGFVV